MKKYKTIIFLIFPCVIISASKAPNNTNSSKESIYNNLQEDLDTLLAWFPGEYDNHEQVDKEVTNKREANKKHRQTHHIFHEVFESLTKDDFFLKPGCDVF